MPRYRDDFATGDARELQLLADADILNVRRYRAGIENPDPLRTELERIRQGWIASGALREARGRDPVLTIVDVPARRM